MVLNIKVKSRQAYFIITVSAIFFGMLAVNAYQSGGPASTLGHDLQELQIGNINVHTTGPNTLIFSGGVGSNCNFWTTGNIGPINILPGDTPARAAIRGELTAYWDVALPANSCPDVYVQFAAAGQGGIGPVTNTMRLTYAPERRPPTTDPTWITAYEEVDIPVDAAGNFDYVICGLPVGGITYGGTVSGCQVQKLYLTSYERALP